MRELYKDFVIRLTSIAYRNCVEGVVFGATLTQYTRYLNMLDSTVSKRVRSSVRSKSVLEQMQR